MDAQHLYAKYVVLNLYRCIYIYIKAKLKITT